MTLFKRVFNAHTHGASAALPLPAGDRESGDAVAFDDDFALDISDTFDNSDTDDASSDDTKGRPAEGAPLQPVEDGPTALEVADASDGPGIADDPAAPDPTAAEHAAPCASEAADAGPLMPQSMAERAALAQKAMALSQARRASAQNETLNRPMASEQRETAADTVPSRPAGNGTNKPVDGTHGPAAGIAAPRPGKEARRVRTRMLGFDTGAAVTPDPFAGGAPDPARQTRTHPVGWLVVVGGPGTGHDFALFNGVSTIGRGSDQSVALDFGDTSISREKHAAVAFDDETNRFYLGHGGKSNIVRLNGRPVLSTEDLAHGDTVRIGETTLRLVALCGTDFEWRGPANADA